MTLNPLRRLFRDGLQFPKRPLRLYIHVPFCTHICSYCDFNRIQISSADAVDWQLFKRAIQTELSSYAKELHAEDGPIRDVHSIFIGGGTPSLVPTSVLKEILQHIRSLWNVLPNVEITMEANPSSLVIDSLKEYKEEVGISRLSIGVQSLQEKDLAFLDRTHSVDDAKRVVSAAVRIFDRINADLIYARYQKQSLNMWRKELQEALDLGIGHASFYGLIVEPGTPMSVHMESNPSDLPTEDEFADMYTIAVEEAEKYGLMQYEVSNFAKAGQECLHHIDGYWDGGDWIGVGPGAAGKIGVGVGRGSISAIRGIHKWFESVNLTGFGIDQANLQTLEETKLELVVSSLRTNRGLLKRTALTHGLETASAAFARNANSLKYLVRADMIDVDGEDFVVRVKRNSFPVLSSIQRLLVS